MTHGAKVSSMAHPSVHPAFSATTRKWMWVVLCVVLLIGAAGAWRTLAKPSTYLLLPEGGAEWIRHDDSLWLGVGRQDEHSVWFRSTVTVTGTPQAAALYVRGFRRVEVYIDSKPVFTGPSDFDQWKQTHRVELSPYLTPGARTLAIKTTNYYAPPCVIAYCDDLDIRTSAEWESSVDGQTWTAARPAAYPEPPEVAIELPPAPSVFLSRFPFFILVFAAAIAMYFLLRSPTYAEVLTPARACAGVFVAIAILFINNLFHLPGDIGFDIRGHYEYIEYIAKNWRVPLPKEGWTMFQAPLFYMLSAPIFAVMSPVGFEQTMDALRLLPMICGVSMVLITFRVLQTVFPERAGMQIAGTVFAGMLPMNLYMSQFPGNETLCACLSGLVLLFAFEAIAKPEKGLKPARIGFAGALYGFALLAKVSALVLGPTIVLMYAYAMLKSRDSRTIFVRKALTTYAVYFGIALLVCGWWFLRNWMEQGRPFFGGWEPERGIPWWQEPGYRTPRQFFAFGESLQYPLYSMTWSFWDGFYSTFWMDAALSGTVSMADAPPWNFRMLLPGLWWALLPTAMIVCGALRVALRPAAALGNGAIFAALLVGLFVAATLHHYLDIPYLSSVKATYTLSALPCYAILLAYGYEAMTRSNLVRPVVIGLLACWAVSSYTGFFCV